MSAKTNAKYINLDTNSIENSSGDVAVKLATTSGLQKSSGLLVGAGAGISVLTSTVAIDTTSTLTFTGGTWLWDTGSQLQTSVAPTTGNDVANKTYVDNLVNGISWKTAVRAATTVAGTLATDFENGDTIDGVTLATNERILIKDQADPTENGLYKVNASGAPTRTTDADTGAELVSAAVFVSEGTVNADTAWVCTTDAPITIGVSNIVFVQFANTTPGDITAVNAGNGLTGGGTSGSVTLTVLSETTVIANVARAINVASTGLGVKIDDSTIGENGSQRLFVKNSGITETQLATSVAGNGLSGGAGTPLAVNVDGTTITIVADTLQANASALGVKTPITETFTYGTNPAATRHVVGPLAQTPILKGDEVHFIPVNPSGPRQEYGVDYVTIQVTTVGNSGLTLNAYYVWFGNTGSKGADFGTGVVNAFDAAGSGAGADPTTGMTNEVSSTDKLVVDYYY